jgi:3-deoxy-D-arabino-heptulosonate 7-phosphate (DAHP) synthase class II
MSCRTRWIPWIAAGALFAAALGYLIPDQVQAHDRYNEARTALGVMRHQTHTVTAQLDEVRRDLNILETQVGSDSTALSQDSSQLLGAQTSLAAAQAHVTQQASLITSLQTCLVGVERALNELAVGKLSNAIAALNSVSPSCTAAEASSG